MAPLDYCLARLHAHLYGMHAVSSSQHATVNGDGPPALEEVFLRVLLLLLALLPGESPCWLADFPPFCFSFPEHAVFQYRFAFGSLL